MALADRRDAAACRPFLDILLRAGCLDVLGPQVHPTRGHLAHGTRVKRPRKGLKQGRYYVVKPFAPRTLARVEAVLPHRPKPADVVTVHFGRDDRPARRENPLAGRDRMELSRNCLSPAWSTAR